MPLGDYTPQFKIGQTIVSTDTRFGDIQYIVIFSYLTLKKYSQYYAERECPSEYNESDSSSVLYCVLEVPGMGDGKYTQTHWIKEEALILYCSNCDRGKKILLNPKHIQLLSDSYLVQGEKLENFLVLLKEPSTET